MIIKILTLILIISNLNSFSQYDTLSIYFEFNKSVISPTQKIKITSFALKQEKHIETIKILGYADYKGSVEYNINLSQNRADNIYDYLISSGLSKNKILSCNGKGKLPGINDNERYKNRRVDIIYKTKFIENKENKKIVEKTENQSNTKLNKIKNANKGDRLVLENMYFIGGRHFLLQQSMPALKELLSIMQNNPNLKIEIQGHICCQDRGDGLDIDTKQDNLSVERAKYIYDYLISEGIDKSRLRYKGFGSSRPLKGTAIYNEANRRVEILVFDK